MPDCAGELRTVFSVITGFSHAGDRLCRWEADGRLFGCSMGSVGKEPGRRRPPTRGPPTDWGELVQAHDDRNVFQATDRRAARDRYPQPLTRTEREASTKPSGARTRRDSAPTPETRHFRGKSGFPGAGFGARETGARGSRVSHQSAHACGSAIGRAIQYPPTPTPTSAPPTMRASACESSRAFGLGWPSKRTIRPI